MEIEEDFKTLSDYLHIARRRKYLIILPMLVLTIITVVLAVALPPVYRSEATILIEQQHIPTEFVKSTVTSLADERIKLIEQKVMTVNNINTIIDKYGLYSKFKKKSSISELANEFRQSMQLTLINTNIIRRGRSHKEILAFKLSFSYKNALIAQKIANELVTLFLDENVRNRTDRALEATVFLEEEAEKIKLEIQKMENQIADYKEKYSESLPELLSVNLSSIDRTESEARQLDLKEKMLIERKISLRTQLAVTSPVSSGLNGAASTQDIPDNLSALQALYKQLLNKYSQSHPDIRAIKRKIDNYEASSNAKEKGRESLATAITNPVYLQLKSEIDIAQIELNNIQVQKKQIKDKLEKLDLRVSQTHQVERGYYGLVRDLDNQKAKYKELKAKALEARLSQTLEEEQKAEKFSLLEPARIPEKPEKPNRFKILLMGFVISVSIGLGVGYLAEMLDGSIRSQKAIVQLTGIEPLVIIPYIDNDEDLARSRKNKIYFSIIGVVFFLGIILAIHFFYMSLDLLWLKVWHRISML